ncbi:MAG: DUF2442 domain-containing protein [Magnetococcus sp. YQC-5]
MNEEYIITPAVLEVDVVPSHHLKLRFDNGEERLFDVRPYLDRGVFQKLRNPHLFALARVAFGTVTWPGELDIAPETLYVRSTPIMQNEWFGNLEK